MPSQWIMYPHIGLGSLGWRMGYGEVYAENQYIWYSSLTESEQKKYQEMFPPPKSWGDYYSQNYGLEYLINTYIENNRVEYSSEKLIEKYNSGKPIEYMFFWKPNAGVVDKGCLCQWQPSQFQVETETYCCAEQYMMARKARLFNNHEISKLIMKYTNPKIIKALGRMIRDFEQEKWDNEKYTIIRDGNYCKFAQNDEMRNFLLSTGDKVLVEASPYDTVWGIGLSENDEKSQNPNTWRGQNLLGFALMEVRDDLRNVYRNYNKIDWSILNSSSDD